MNEQMIALGHLSFMKGYERDQALKTIVTGADETFAVAAAKLLRT
jgi:hypothetical protein